jgi:16S rRNA (guanine527-N7)-methyltransferase
MSDISLLLEYFPYLTATQKAQFGALQELYAHWNAQINVVSRQDVENLYEKHVLHSLGIAKVVALKPTTEVLDVGTGGGFPGIPLAILFPQASFHLIDSIGKKIKVVQEVVKELQLTNVRAEQIRVEEVTQQYEFVVSRAVTRALPLYGWVRGKVSQNNFHEVSNGILCLKGGDLAEELKELNRKTRVYELSDYFRGEFFDTKKVVHIPFF